VDRRGVMLRLVAFVIVAVLLFALGWCGTQT
jgi:hypothetical protein